MRILVVCAFVLACVGGAFAQDAPSAQSNGQNTVTSASPQDYSGMYSFLRDGEFVQITVEDNGKLTGFVSRYGDLDSDRGAFLDQFFKEGSIGVHDLSFTTETVHGVWFHFQGTASRGPGKTVNDEGYYILKGTLTHHTTDANRQDVAKSREVVFKSFPQDVSAPSTKPKD
ncbi:MAG TPA: hypothetical protein VFU27_09760 [Terriglobales bacterium]|nr:hypothetical protein [Terriglobales bacterium]